jgi:hypothetical protein
VKTDKIEFDFEKMYSYYPRKEGKDLGMKKLQTQVKTQAMYDKVTQAIINYNNLVTAKQTEKKFIKQFSSWVNQKCWEDEIEVVKTQDEIEKDMIQKLGGLTYETREPEIQ